VIEQVASTEPARRGVPKTAPSQGNGKDVPEAEIDAAIDEAMQQSRGRTE
jgi:hypothetical protein